MLQRTLRGLDLRVVEQIIRDPRATFAARQKRLAGRDSISAFAYSWLRSARAAQRNPAFSAPGRFLEVRYEDLVGNPATQVSRLARFLSIQEEDILSRPTVQGGRLPWTGNSAYGKQFHGVQTSSVERWRQALHPAEIQLIEALLRDEMLAHGYEPAYRASASLKVRAAGLRLLIVARQVRDRAIVPPWSRAAPSEGR
jgi:hypothetical protein